MKKPTKKETWETSLTFKALKLFQSGIASTMNEGYQMAENNFKIVKGT